MENVSSAGNLLVTHQLTRIYKLSVSEAGSDDCAAVPILYQWPRNDKSLAATNPEYYGYSSIVPDFISKYLFLLFFNFLKLSLFHPANW